MRADQAKKVLAGIEPSNWNAEFYQKHRKSIERCLADVMGARQTRVIGSYSRKTAVRGTSDLDLMVILPRRAGRWGDSLKSSSTVLKSVRSVLMARYPQTVIRTDGQAVIVSFDAGRRAVDVVPALFLEAADLPAPARNYPMFLIPDGSDGWLRTSPEAHNRYIQEENIRSGRTLQKIAMLLKLWRNLHPELMLKSFFVELLLIQEEVCRPGRSYGHSLKKAFSALSQTRCASVADPLGISNRIWAANTPVQRTAIRIAARRARAKVTEALACEADGDFVAANELWQEILGVELY